MSPNFCPSSDAVKQVIVWVINTGIPIEYYDHRMLTFIGTKYAKQSKSIKPHSQENEENIQGYKSMSI